MAKSVGERLISYILKPYHSKWGERMLERFPVEGISEYQTEGITKKQWQHIIPENQSFFDKYGLNDDNRYVVQAYVEALSRYKYGVRDPHQPKLISDETLDMIRHLSGSTEEIERRIMLTQGLDGIEHTANNMAKVMGERKAYLMGRAIIREWSWLMEPVMDHVLDEMLPQLRKQKLYNFDRKPAPDVQQWLYTPKTYTSLVIQVAAEITRSCERSRMAVMRLGLLPEGVTAPPVLEDNPLLIRIADAAEKATELYTEIATRDEFDPTHDPDLYLPRIAEIKEQLSPLVGASLSKEMMKRIEQVVDQKIQLLRRTGGQNLDLGDLPPERSR